VAAGPAPRFRSHSHLARTALLPCPAGMWITHCHQWPAGRAGRASRPAARPAGTVL